MPPKPRVFTKKYGFKRVKYGVNTGSVRVQNVGNLKPYFFPKKIFNTASGLGLVRRKSSGAPFSFDKMMGKTKKTIEMLQVAIPTAS